MKKLLDLTIEDYHKDTSRISKSGLDLINRSPLHYKHSLTEERKETPAMVLGQASHAAVFEAESFQNRFAVAPICDRRTKDGKAKFAEFEAQLSGQKIITQEQYETAMSIRESVFGHPIIKDLLQKGEAEKSLFWECPETGAKCRSRFDFIAEGDYVIDLKTTEDARDSAFARSVYNYRYHVQDSFYSEGYFQAFGTRPTFLFIAVEKTAPYNSAVYFLDAQAKDIGRQEYLENLMVYQKCLKADKWPGYDQTIQALSLPAWAINK